MTREEAIDFAEFLKSNWLINFADMEKFCDMAIEALQAEPIVHCKDCKHYIPSKEMPHRGWCDDALQNVFKEDFYCGFGKRREP